MLNEFAAWAGLRMGDTAWWPVAESIHFIGLSLLFGCVGLFDLRLLGVGSRISFAAMHRLIPWGVAGFLMNLITGLAFYATAPDRYTYNPVFQIKILLIMLAGLNILVFYSIVFPRLRALEPGAKTPILARCVGGISFLAWIGVITAGRLLPFYADVRSCPWC